MITIRNARRDEAQLLADIGFRAWEKAMIPVGETKAMVENARAAFRNFTSSGWLTISVIELNGQPAGWAAREELDEDITDFWIDPEFQGMGLGTALLEELEKEILRQGFDKASLQTHARNEEAVHFFEKRGYSVHWLTIAYNPKLDRDVQSVGLSKQLAAPVVPGYGQEF
ncbi:MULTISPECIES: GNAT family N-acetyltransferase [Alphaproteobacteria]|uniref:N-acetyltransferase n=2 Tax=Alphaproteobacteria TaxID=28211 RepID=A0A512HLZ8_9HYPH|nr:MULTISPECIES: GNAT family N-acetyltransferase [Alphaproteobacteria]GEO86430.1 N-acetyltransferase [Ciceribacter naphthalenivorans]GLR22308.1 N-acetyltransferase [Ciceribacter naphthalenivorans]GLT05164.1 N-acetyltransferase [Sphingomonas psychrolutea]